MANSDNKTATPAGVPDLTKAEVKNAKKDGALDYIKDNVAGAMASDTGTTMDAEELADARRYEVSAGLNTTFIADLLNLDADTLTDRLKDKPKNGDHIDFEIAKGLLALERSGKNRTNYVRALMKAIGVDDPYKVTTAGPPYTNDETAVTAL